MKQVVESDLTAVASFDIDILIAGGATASASVDNTDIRLMEKAFDMPLLPYTEKEGAKRAEATC